MPCGQAPSENIEDLRRERDLYHRLLQLGGHREIEPFLEEALTLLIQLGGARRGSLDLRDLRDKDGAPGYAMARGLDAQDPRSGFSRSVAAEALATGETIVTASAQIDPRFENSGSVRSQALEAVLCTPIGRSPPIGVVYLQDRIQPGPFTNEDRARAEMFAAHIAAFADRLLLRRRRVEEVDPTAAVRRTLKVEGIIGGTRAVAEVLKQVALVAPLQISVLVTGPSGSGKTQLARAIHDNSPRAGRPFIEVNCGALPGELIESELFGAVKGAHSTAVRTTEGKVAAAEGGTLFLDEVGELPPRAQASLLQMLQSKTYFPLGASASRLANVRVLAATNANLEEMAAERRFRDDLYYRLNVFPIRVPGLSERRADIPLLAEHFCRLACEVNGLPQLELSLGALSGLEMAEWPGEIRELSHAIQAGVVRAFGEASAKVERHHVLPLDEVQAGEPGQPGQPNIDDMSFQGATRRFQRELVIRALAQSGGNVSAAARTLQVTRAHIYNLMATFGLKRPNPGSG